MLRDRGMLGTKEGGLLQQRVRLNNGHPDPHYVVRGERIPRKRRRMGHW
jgi:hypothetical protein